MTLKQEFIDMLHLIVDSIQAKDKFALYEIEVDSCRDICTKYDGQDVSYGWVSECKIGICESCPHHKFVNVDVSFGDCGDVAKNYLFNGTAPVKGITVIRNRKQLLKEVLELKDIVEASKNRDAEFAVRYKQYLTYAKEFAEKVKQDYPMIFGLIDTDILPIVLNPDCNMIDVSNEGRFTARPYNNQTVIKINYCKDDCQVVKMKIRHELLHYMLYIAGHNHNDDSANFHYLCDGYDAHAYKEMPEIEQKLYDGLKNVIEKLEKINDLDAECKKNFIDSLLFYIGAKTELLEKEKVYQDIYDAGKRTYELIDKLRDEDELNAS